MKKLYFFFALLFSLVGVTQTFAQDEITIQVNKDNGQWTKANAAKTWGAQWASFQTDPQLTISQNNGANNMDYYDGTNIEFFDRVGSGSTGTQYNIEAEGYYIKSVSMEFRCSQWNNSKNTQTDAPITVTLNGDISATNESTEDFIFLEAKDLDDVTLVAMTITYEGTANAFAQTRNFIVTLKKMGESEVAKKEMSEKLEELRSYKDAFRAGTAPGLYDAELVAAFQAAIEEADMSVDNPDLDDMPDEDRTVFFRELTAKLTATYEAVLASKVPMTLADGYYRIKSGMTFYKTTTVTDDETQEEVTTTEYFDKYMYTVMSGANISAKWATPDDVATDCPSLWYISNKEGGLFDIRSVASNGHFVPATNPVTLSAESEALMQIDPLTTTEEGVTYVDIRISTENTNSYLHCGGHSSGKGESGNIVKYRSEWSGDEKDGFSATEWIIVPVSEEEANAAIETYMPIMNRELMLYDYQNTLANAKNYLAIAKDMQQINLITDNSQFSSPWTETSEGSINNLLDGNTTTYWHSAWQGGNVENHTHYLQVALTEPVDEDLYITIGRRVQASNGQPVVNDHITQWGVFGSNDPDAADEEWVELGNLATPYNNSVLSGVKSESTFRTQGMKYLRFYIDNTTTGRGYGHVSEFQVCYDAPNENAQVRFMGDLANNLESVIKAQADLEIDDIQEAEYNALKNAYDAFMAKFVDPTELRDLLSKLEGAADVVVVGDQPGFWTSNSEATLFNATYDAAKEYDEKGDYSPQQSKNYVETLNSLNDNIFASAIKIKTGKWYRIRFASETTIEDGEEIEGEFDKYGWDKVAGNGTYNNDSTILVNEPLFGKYVTVSYLDDDETANNVVSGVEAEEFGMGSNLFFDEEDDIYDETLSLFRFIAVSDSAYIIQNKGTNLFLKAAGTSGAVTLSPHPSLFNVSALGYGENIIAARDINGVSQAYLHGQVNGNQLVTWGPGFTPYPGSRSGLYIEEVDDVESNYDGTEFQALLIPGSLHAYCFPVEVSAIDGKMWSVLSVDTENNSISLVKIEKAVAGRPFLYIYGETNEYSEDGSTEPALFTFSHAITAKEPMTDALLKGTFAPVNIDRGDIYTSGSGFAVSKISLTDPMEQPTRIPANSAYIRGESKFKTNADVVIVWDEDSEDPYDPTAIQTALENVSRSGAVYTIDGRLVSNKANLNDLSRFGKGIYILNGTKVVVK